MASEMMKKFRSSKKAQIAFCAGGLLFSFLYLYWQAGSNLGSLIPSQSRLDTIRGDLKKATVVADELMAKMNEVNTAEKLFNENMAGFWNPAVNGSPDVELRKKIEVASQSAGLKLNSIGTVRRSRINNDLTYLEIDMAGTETLEVLTLFFEEIYKIRPKLYWKRMDLRQEHLQNSERLIFSGTLRLIALESGK